MNWVSSATSDHVPAVQEADAEIDFFKLTPKSAIIFPKLEKYVAPYGTGTSRKCRREENALTAGGGVPDCSPRVDFDVGNGNGSHSRMPEVLNSLCDGPVRHKQAIVINYQDDGSMGRRYRTVARINDTQ
jgi:hypothetical protein